MSLKGLEGLSIPDDVRVAISNFVGRVREAYPDAELYLFGSYAKNTWVEGSDIDIIVVSKGFRGMSLGERARKLRKLASKTLPFEILAYTPEEFAPALRRSITLQDASEYWIKL